MVPAVGTPTMGVNVNCEYAGVGGVVVILARAVVDAGNAIGGQWWRREVGLLLLLSDRWYANGSNNY
jgi:hypothetical protein